MALFDPAEVAALRTESAAAFFADAYQLQRDGAGTADSRGNRTPTVSVVESGACLLSSGGAQPQEQAVADRLGWTSHYKVRLPVATAATPKDRLIVNGARMFEIGAVLIDGAWGLMATAICAERG
ncbi:MAG: hypothetical protein ACR2OO_04040 [Thermomicrobiales bacterium]